MKTKDFRFLFCGRESCFLHFGEIKDTLQNEMYTFMYLRGTKEAGSEKEGEEWLFSCPKHVDLLVVGNVNAQTEAVLTKLLGETVIDTVVLPQSDYQWSMKPVKETTYIFLSEQNTTWRVKAAGWGFFMKCYADNSIMMMHGLDQKTAENTLFEDCIMNVKVLDGLRFCCHDSNTDGYVCALGCVLQRDYDVCRYLRNGSNPYLTGTLLCGEINSREAFKELKQDIGKGLEFIRFFEIPTAENDSRAEVRAVRKEEREYLSSQSGSYKRYYIGLEKEVKAETVRNICGCGLYQIPVLMRDGKGICCSGLLKYKEV